ncbi:MAG: SemiSWEET transporter [Myxococcales bacterium]|nr:SemiSWEET transporter [Myxococcales bacterium]
MKPETLVFGLGIAAACLTTGSWIPQALQTIRTRSARDFSWSYLSMFGAGIALWFVYGVLRHDVAIWGANAVALVLVSGIVRVKIKYG